MRSFKFDFIKDNIEMVCEFKADISSVAEGKQLSEELLRDLKMIDTNFHVEYLHWIFDVFVQKHDVIIPSSYKKSLNVFLEINEEDWRMPKSRYNYLKYYFFGITDIENAIGKYDFYYSIASFGHFIDGGYEASTVLIRRIKDGNTYNYKDIQQVYSDDSMDGDFGSIQIQDVSYKRTIDSMSQTKSIQPIFEEQGFGEDFLYLPVSIPNVRTVTSFSLCIDALINIESINTKEDLTSVKQQWS